MENSKPFGLHGIEFDGVLFADYIQIIVDQINSGVVPKIEDTYTYICREKCNQAKIDAVELFKQNFNQKLKLPCAEDSLKELCKNSLQIALNYVLNSIGKKKAREKI